MGTPLIHLQRDATQAQSFFLQLALKRYVDEERDFQIALHGGEPSKQSTRPGSVKDNARNKVKDPRTVKRKP